MTSKSAVADVMVGIGIYTMLAYKSFYEKWFTMLTVLFGVLISLYALCIFTRKVKGKTVFQISNRDRKIFIIKNRFLRILNIAGLCLGIMMAVMLVPIGYNRIVYYANIMADSKYSTTVSDANNTENGSNYTSDYDIIEKIRENARWKPLSIEEKVEVLQAVCDYEAKYFGLDYRVTVVLEDLDEGILGGYNDWDKEVIIDIQHLEEDDAHTVLRTCLHEMYHAYEHSLVRLYLDSTVSQRKLRVFRHCEEYINEMQNYKASGDSYESFMEYYCQYMEKDSREYAQKSVYEYYQAIDSFEGNLQKYNGRILDGDDTTDYYNYTAE